MIEQVTELAGTESPTRIVAILGMHRSGTSCLTGSLQASGLFLGDCHTWNPHNRKGNRENQQFVDLHDAILESNGGAWDAPPARVVWNSEQVVTARRLLKEHASAAIFGFKDPRTLLVLEGWKALVPGLEFVGIFRHPDAVARSLAKRSSMAREDALNLWYVYNSLLYREYRSRPFPILNFDDEEAILESKILSVADDIGLQERSGEEKFYSAELKSAAGLDRPALPWRVRRLLKKLQKVSL